MPFVILILLVAMVVSVPSASGVGQAADGLSVGDGRAAPSARAGQGGIDAEVSHVLSKMKWALEGDWPHDFLTLIDSARFDDYLRFKDTIERLMRDDTLVAYFQVAGTSMDATGVKAQATVDAVLEVTRHDAAVETQVRRQHLVLDFARTPNGWRITNITPRGFFDSL